MLLNLILMNKEGPVRGGKAGDSLGYRDHEIVEFSILKQDTEVGRKEAGQQAKLQPWTFGELTLASLGTFLEESHGDGHCRKKGSKRDGQYSSTTSSRSGAS